MTSVSVGVRMASYTVLNFAHPTDVFQKTNSTKEFKTKTGKETPRACVEGNANTKSSRPISLQDPFNIFLPYIADSVCR